MDIFSYLTDSLHYMFSNAWVFTRSGGWILFVTTFLYIAKHLWHERVNHHFIEHQNWVFLHIKIEKENLQSLLAVEQMFSNLHALHANFTFAEKWLEGKVNLWFSMEIVSIGGKISFIVRTPKQSMQLVQSAFYSHFSNAEITVIDDYMEHLKHWDHKKSSWDLWGTEFKMTKNQAYPIRTWREFEHPAAEEPILDPLSTLYEALSRAEPHELMAVQYILRPVQDSDWVPQSASLVKKLKEEEDHNKGFIENWFPFFFFGSKKTVFEAIAGSGKGGAHGDEAPKQPKVMRMSEGEKAVLLGIEEKMKKPAWETKIRFLYIAPKDKFDGSKKSAMIGAFRGFTSSQSNGLKPDVSGTWTNYNYALFKGLEKPFVDYKVQYKKEEFLKGYTNRSRWIGQKEMVMNTEELATLIHFPLASVKTSSVERIDVKRGQPPSNLPIAEGSLERAY